MPNKQPNVATGEGRVSTKKTPAKKKTSKKTSTRPTSSRPSARGYDWGDGKGAIHSIPLREHEQNVSARQYGIDLNAPVSQPLTNRGAYGLAEQAADRVYQPQIDAVTQLQASVPGWYANYMAQVAAQQGAAKAYAQPIVQQAQQGVQNAGTVTPGLDPSSAQYATEQQAAKGRQSIAQLGADTLSAVPVATDAYMAGQATVAQRELPAVLANYGLQKGQLRAQRGQAVAENYQALRGQEQNAQIAYDTLGLNTQKAAADVDLSRGVDPVTGRPLPQDAPTGYGPGGPQQNSFGYTYDEWNALSDKQRQKARDSKGGGSQADKDARKEQEKLEKKRAAIRKATGKLKTRINEARATWERYARMENPATKYDPARGENVPDIDPKTGRQRTKKATPDQIKAQMRKDGYSETEIHVMLMIRAGKPLTQADVQALRGIDPNIRIPREWLKKKTRPRTRGSDSPAAAVPGVGDATPPVTATPDQQDRNRGR